MKIALAQQNYHIGNFENNTRKIIEGIKMAKEQGADLVCFQNYVFADILQGIFLNFNDFINKCYEAIDADKRTCRYNWCIDWLPHAIRKKKAKIFSMLLSSYMKKK